MKDRPAARGVLLHLPDDPAELAAALDLALHVEWLGQPCEVLTARVSERRREHRLLWVPGLARLSRQDERRRFRFARAHPDGEHVVIEGQKTQIARREHYDSVIQLLPPQRWERPAPFESVYFLAEGRAAFEELVSRCLVLGLEGLAFEFLEAEGEESILLVVPDPSEELLEEWATKQRRPGVTAYYRVVQAPACVEWGYEHPWAVRLRSSASVDFVWLIRGDGQWRRLPIGDLRDIYELVSIDATAFAGRTWRPLPPGRPFAIRIRLVPATQPAAAQMWVLPGEGVALLERLLSEMPEAAAAGLMFARYRNSEGNEVLVLYDSDSGQAAERLGFVEKKFASVGDPANLLIPVADRLCPTVRPERLAETFEIRQGQWTVLDRDAAGDMLLYRMDQSDFEPMSAVTKHLLDAGQAELHRIMAASVFEFESLEAPPEPPGGLARKLKRVLGRK